MKKAFSLLELVLVIFIIGIIFSLINFYKPKDRLMEAAVQILNDIVYVRNLAMLQTDFRIKEFSVAKREWYKSKWQLYFIKSSSATNNEQTYTIFLDKNGDGNANLGKTDINLDREIAVDILNPTKLMNSGQSGVISKLDKKASKRFNIEEQFGISSVEFKGSCSGSTRIVFDELGRLYSPLKNAKNIYDKTLTKKNEPCIIRLQSKFNKQICIVIDPLTGYAYIPKFKSFNNQPISFKNTSKLCSKI
ncbi:prepilin-type N-terminal cleavage/methylation domain-containing protein [Campylobacter sp. TTU-622]|uniref:pilus assembly FimT family protein n=1 Tax=Campylobacter sp. TTU-622 TaxID=2800583 RepID=UPI0019048A6E|nr:prepilin-type N-terminal cleavage/methylation domain-containing protein [Campylobacter sp. TTU-622]MBK1972962.1 prepilin-type N-terminal cleavage/methylation domain-containing protein [Campylobacter sp. TTU-622]